jgi:RimJ/RimL family protein N-acetyltransferase
MRHPPTDPDDSALGEVGYLLDETARGRGAASRAMWLLVDWSFREPGMERVQALVHPDNGRSAAVLGASRRGKLL